MTPTTQVSPGRIFISYRREDAAYPAGWLFDRLADHFGEGQIFKDVDSIEPGEDFVEAIDSAVGSCDVLLAVIGDEWLTSRDDRGRRRLDLPDDFVRHEIEAALRRDVRVIPILVESAAMPRAESFPPSLGGLVRRQALVLRPTDFGFDSIRLLAALDKALAEVQAARMDGTATPALPRPRLPRSDVILDEPAQPLTEAAPSRSSAPPSALAPRPRTDGPREPLRGWLLASHRGRIGRPASGGDDVGPRGDRRVGAMRMPGRRLVLAVVGSAVLLAVALLAGRLPIGSLDSSRGVSDPGSSAVPSHSMSTGVTHETQDPTATARRQAQQVERLLDAAAVGRGLIGPAVLKLGNCDSSIAPGEAVDAIRRAAANRSSLVEALQGQRFDALPAGSGLKVMLGQAWSLSLQADEHYLAWAESIAEGDSCDPRAAQKKAGDASSLAATQAKRSFAAAWNDHVAGPLGLALRKESQL